MFHCYRIAVVTGSLFRGTCIERYMLEMK